MNSVVRCVLGIDLGTSSLKCVVIDNHGQLRASSERSYPTKAPHPGWAEQNPDDWIEALREALDELRQDEPELIACLEAIGLCSAAHIPVLLDKEDKIIRPAILWSDQRSEAEVGFLKSRHREVLKATTLNDASCTWTLPQLLWVGNNEPTVLPRVCRLLSSKDYLVFRLTGESTMDPASAAATLMMDARAKRWALPLISLSGLRETAFPRLVSPFSVVGRVTKEAAQALGLPEGVRVVSGTLDSAAELLGCGILTPGNLGMVRVGSAGGIMAVTDQPSYNQGIITYPHVSDGLYYKQAGTNSCATSLKWIRNLCRSMRGDAVPELTYELLDRLAATANPGADGLIFHPYIQGERAPYWNPELRGSFTGVDQRHGWPQLVRAVMEGVAFSLLDCLKMFRRDGLDMNSAVMTGGVTKSVIWSQIITDVLGMETRTIRQGDSALGASMIAATGIGMFDSITTAVGTCVALERVMQPNPEHHVLYGEKLRRYLKVSHFLDSLEEHAGR